MNHDNSPFGRETRGQITRRQLMKTVGAASAAGSVGARLVAQGTQGFKTLLVDHISYEVSDYKRSRDWYADVLGMTVQEDNGTSNAYLRFGDTVLIVRNPRTG